MVEPDAKPKELGVEENSMFTSYRINDPDVVNSGFTLLVDADTNEIGSIIIQYDPRTLN